jgi:hypothetical protein
MMIEDPKSYARIGNTILENQKLFSCWSTVYSDEMRRLLYGMYLANLRSYNERYEENSEPFYSFEDFDRTVKCCHEEYSDMYQLLKSLHCLDYQIEVESKKVIGYEFNGIEFLKKVIRTVEWYIINQSGDYEKAKWTV